MRKVQSAVYEKREISCNNWNAPIEGRLRVPSRDIKRKPLSH